MKKRVLCILLALSMCIPILASIGTLATAAEDTVNICNHHEMHDDECGYVEAVEGQPCTHVHSEDCIFSEAANDGDLSSGTFHEESDLCDHEHDADCGYVEAVEGAPCTFVCEICGKSEGEEPATDEAQENTLPVDEESSKLNEETVKESLLRRIQEGSFDPYSADMSLEEFYALMELFDEGVLPLEEERPAVAAIASIAAVDAANEISIPRTMFLFSGLKMMPAIS